MKKPIFILRFGIESLIDLDREALGHLQEELEDIAGCVLPFGILTIINTDQSPKELKDLYVQAAEELGDHAPVVVWDPASKDATFDLQDFPQVKDMIDAWETHYDEDLIPKKNDICNMTLDELIDKVGRTGRESLTPLEFARLKVLSKNP